jgi:pyruvate carboxylase subunit B
MESMKMENTIAAPAAGKVRSVLVKEGDTVQHGQSLIELE